MQYHRIYMAMNARAISEVTLLILFLLFLVAILWPKITRAFVASVFPKRAVRGALANSASAEAGRCVYTNRCVRPDRAGHSSGGTRQKRRKA
jgi:hypothetical protein